MLALSILVNIVLAAVLFWGYARPLRRLERQVKSLGAEAEEGAIQRENAFAQVAQRFHGLRERHAAVARELAEQRELSSAIFDSLHSGLVLTDASFRIVFANKQFRAWFCPGGKDCVGSTPVDVCVAPRLLALGREVRQSRDSREAEFPLARPGEGAPDGSSFHVGVLPAQKNPAGEVRQFLFIFDDVTRLQRLETIRRDFVANASHELRTPLSIVSGYLENLLDGVLENEPEVARRFLCTMQKHTERLKAIVSDLLTLSRLESHSNTLEAAPMDLAECFTEVTERLQPIIKRLGARVTAEWESAPFPITADRFCIDQVLFNLLDNALKHGERPGLAVTITGRRDNGCAHIKIEDNGPGIPLKDQPYIFNRFYRVAKDRAKTTTIGTGLGLSIVKHAIEAHGGAITLDSQPGAGTRINITLPVRPAVG